jgi:PAS domain S-box-containing protein
VTALAEAGRPTPVPGTLRRRVVAIATLGGVLLLVMILLVTLALALAVFDAFRLDRLRNSEHDSTLLLVSLQSQDKGIRDYMESGQAQLLAPYSQGQQAADQALLRLRTGAAHTPRAAEVAQAEAAARSWQAWAEAMRLRTAAARGPLADRAAAEQGRQLFAAFVAVQSTLESGIETESQAARLDMTRAVAWCLTFLIGGSALLSLVLIRLGRRALMLSLTPLQELAETAHDIARSGQAQIPHTARNDEIGEVARALQSWRDASAEREILIEQAPVAISRVTRTGQIVDSNLPMQTMFGYPRETLRGRSFLELIHPDDRTKDFGGFGGLLEGSINVYATEARHIRQDGTIVWCSKITSSVRGPNGRPESFIAIMEDITDNKRQLERAARIQRELLPTRPLDIEGYDLAGACRPAQDVAGDFYDWVGYGGRYLDLTVADVMGKGVPAALVMATVRAALRAAPPDLDPAARVRLAAECMAVGGEDEGLFVTLFHCRLDLRTGLLRYVDAGHGHCRIRHPNGELQRFPERSLPLFVMRDEPFREGATQLQPGDILLVHSDGLVEKGDETLSLDVFREELSAGEGAEDLVERLMGRVPLRPTDDVTVVALQRQLKRPGRVGATRASP